MKIFIDSADIEEIREANSWGIVDGVTTNPSLIKKAMERMKGEGMEEYIRTLLKEVKDAPVSLEVIGSTEDDMMGEARRLFDRFNGIAGNVVIKIPVNPSMDIDSKSDYDGLKVIRRLNEEKIPVNCTLIFTPEQALLAAKAGARYVSPFAGRVDDLIRKDNGIEFDKSDYYPAKGIEKSGNILEDNGIASGVDLIRQTKQIFDNYGIKAEIIAASLRNERQVRECMLAGAHIGTIPFSVIRRLTQHLKTAEGMRSFADDVVPEYRQLFSQH